MAATRRVLCHALPRIVVTLALALGLSGAVSLAAAPQADAAVSTSMSVKVLQTAASKKGTPYRSGASGPSGFDCSGYTKWVYAKVGKRLPRTSQAQYNAALHIRASQRRPGDLVFFANGSHVYHVGIYAGGGRIWHSPKSGDRVKLAKIWTSKVKYGRVR